MTEQTQQADAEDLRRLADFLNALDKSGASITGTYQAGNEAGEILEAQICYDENGGYHYVRLQPSQQFALMQDNTDSIWPMTG